MILPVGFSLLLRRWLATLLFGVLALCGGLLMSGASAEAEPTSSIQRVASYDRGSTTTPTGNTRIVAVGADRELAEAPRPYASRIALGRAAKAAKAAGGVSIYAAYYEERQMWRCNTL
jgi:ABC-type Fe3+-hydroxamate transport system substrate-binding protein